MNGSLALLNVNKFLLKTFSRIAGSTLKKKRNGRSKPPKKTRSEMRELHRMAIDQILALAGISFGAMIALVIPPKLDGFGIVWAILWLTLGIAFMYMTRNMLARQKRMLLIPVGLNVLVISCSVIQALDLFGLNFLGDWRYALPRNKAGWQDTVSLVVIDEKTKAAFGCDLGGYRNRHPVVMQNLINAGAQVIAFDMTFPNNEFGDTCSCSIASPANTVVLIPDQYNFYSDTFFPSSEYSKSCKLYGKQAWRANTHNLFTGDADKTVRSVELMTGQGYLAISFAAYLVSTGAEPVSGEDGPIFKTHDGEVKRAGLNSDPMKINYSGKPIKSVSYIDIYSGKFKEGQFDGDIVLIGEGSTLQVPAFPFQRSMPTAEIHANAIGTLLDGAFITELPRKFYTVFILLIMTINLHAFMKRLDDEQAGRTLYKRFVCQSVILIVVALLGFRIFDLWVEISYPLVAIWLTFLAFKQLELRLREKRPIIQTMELNHAES